MNPTLARLKAAWGPASFQTLVALGLRELAEDVEAELKSESRDRDTRLARAAEKGDERLAEADGP